MKRLVGLALSALAISALPTTAGAQLFGPTVRTVSATKWFDPGRVVIRGSNFFFVDRVTVDGVEVPIVRRTGSVLVIRPPAAEGPGFATVEVFNPQGSDTGLLPYAPTVSATRSGNRMDVRIENGGPGFYVLFASYSLSSEPIAVRGVKYSLLLDLDSPAATTVTSGNLIDTGGVTLERLRIPIDPGLAQRPLFLQVLGQQGFGRGKFLRSGELSPGTVLEVTRSFSNVFELVRQPPGQATGG